MLRGSSAVEAVSSVLGPQCSCTGHLRGYLCSFFMAQLWKLEQEEASSASGRHPAPCTKCSHNWDLPLLHPIGLSAAQFKGGRSQKECTLEPRPWQSGGHVCKAAVGSKEAEILAVCSVSKITRAKRVNLLFFLSTLFKKF